MRAERCMILKQMQNKLRDARISTPLVESRAEFENSRMGSKLRSEPLSAFVCEWEEDGAKEAAGQPARGAEEARPVFLRVGFLGAANGSAYVETGETKVLVAVYGPLDARGAETSGVEEQAGRGTLEVEWSGATASLQPSEGPSADRETRRRAEAEEAALAALLHSALSPAICLDRLPKARLKVRVRVVEDDGGVVAAAVTAAGAALASAGLHMLDLPLAASVLVRGPNIRLDPSNADIHAPAQGDCMDTDSGAGDDFVLDYGVLGSLSQVSLYRVRGRVESGSRLAAAQALAADQTLRLHSLVADALRKAHQRL